MAYRDFLEGLAEIYKLPNIEALTTNPRYAFQVGSRERAIKLVERLGSHGIEIQGKRVLDVGCAYGSFCIEFAKAGAVCVGVDIDQKWLGLAELNAAGEDQAVTFVMGDASARRTRDELAAHGPFDLVIINDVLEHVFDTAGLLSNISSLMAPGGQLFFQVPNGLAPQAVLSEGHKKVFGISLLPPDYWSHFVPTPFHIYYRRWPYFEALFRQFGFAHTDLTSSHDYDHEWTKRKLAQDIKAIKSRFADNTGGYNDHQKQFLSAAIDKYEYELRSDLKHLSWSDLKRKYRQHFWDGLLTASRPTDRRDRV